MFIALAVGGTAAATALLFGAGSAAAATNVYCPSGNLQTALNGAGFGDTIVVHGTCFGNFTINGKTLTLQGASPGATLNGKGTGSALEITNSDVTIVNVTFTNGDTGGSGGGIDVYNSDLNMTNSIVALNHAFIGGGISIDESSVNLTGVTVTRNRADYRGGGIDVSDGSQLSLTASTVSLNTSSSIGVGYGGGGIRMEDSNVLLTSSRVTSNTSADFGGGIADYGPCRIDGGLPVQGIRCGDQTPPAGTAGGRSVADRGLPISIDTGLTLVNSSVDHNRSADDGGGIYNKTESTDSPVVLQGSVVSFNNSTNGDGGGIANYGSCGDTASVLSTGSTFQGNGAKNGDGGAIYNESEGCEGYGGAALVTMAQSNVSTAPNTLNSNTARHGGGFANEQIEGLASLTIQPGVRVTQNKASATGGGVWNDCGSIQIFGANIMLNTPNNVVTFC